MVGHTPGEEDPPAGPGPPGYPAAAPTVLIVDDDSHIRALFAASLAPGGYRLLEAADGDAAWRLVRAHRPAVVVSDVAMPGRSGPELTRAIKADPDLAPTYVILVSGTAAPAALAAIRDGGADRFLPKPVSPRVLAQAVAAGLDAGAAPAAGG